LWLEWFSNFPQRGSGVLAIIYGLERIVAEKTAGDWWKKREPGLDEVGFNLK
jgi:hypothetical protein